MTEAEKNKEALYPTNQDIDAHNDKIATMLELVQRNQELKEKARKMMEKAYSWELDDNGDRILWSALYADHDMILMELKERVRELEDAIEQTLAHRGPDWASILRYALKGE